MSTPGSSFEAARDERGWRIPDWLALQLRRLIRRHRWRTQFRRLERIGKIGAGRRAFLVGSGPSLLAMDLSPLAGEFVCVANMAIRTLGERLPHADMHVMNDSHGYERYAAEVEAILLRHPVTYRFLNHRARRTWRRFERGTEEPIFVAPHTTKLLPSREVPPVAEGVANGPTVLISAAILLRHLGFDPVYILGCDLEYSVDSVYFYEMSAADLEHEADPEVVARRRGWAVVNDYFEVVRADFERQGSRLINAGVGGRLNCLPRVIFEDLFR